MLLLAAVSVAADGGGGGSSWWRLRCWLWCWLLLCATYNIPRRFLKNKRKNLFTYVVGRDNTSCGPHSIFIYEASKIIRIKVASHKLGAMITLVVGHFCDRKLYTSSYCSC